MSNSKLARKLRVKLQLRDKKGRWIEMGRGAKWLNFDGQSVAGVVIGSKGNVAIIRQKNSDGTLSNKNINVHMNQIEMINEKANLDPETIALVDQFNKGQSVKGQKESAAREKALAEAKAGGDNQPKLAEVQYEVSLQDELEDALDRAPAESTLTTISNSLKFTKNDEGSWVSNLSKTPYSSKEMAMDEDIAEDYALDANGDGLVEQEVDQLFKKISEGYNDPDDEKATVPEGADTEEEVSVPETSNSVEDPATKTPDMSLASLKKAGVGSKLIHKDGLELIKDKDGKWYTDTKMPFTSEGLTFNKPEEFKAEFVDVSAPQKTAIQVSKEAPIDISQWKYHQGTQGGSNPGGVYTDTEGQQHYVKHSKSDTHAKNEVLADKFYEALGIKTSQLKLADVGNGKLGTSSTMLDGSKPNFYSQAKTDKDYLAKFQEGFAVDAWLANWDVVGLEYDNALTDANGDPVRIDPGGALLYRAMGSPKGDMFGDEVGEWESMRNGSNPASKIFGSMTDDQLKASVAKLNNISDEDIDAIVDSMDFDPETSDYLKGTLKTRKENLLDKYPDVKAGSFNAPSAKDWDALVEDAKLQIENGEPVDLTPFVDVMPDTANIYAEWENYKHPEIPAFNDLTDGYSEDQMASLKTYVQSSDDINWMLRGTHDSWSWKKSKIEDTATDILGLDSLIEKSVIKEDTSVFRGVAMSSDRLEKFLSVGVYTDKAFTSTSTDKSLAEGWSYVHNEYDPDKTSVMMEIELPKGFTAHRVNYNVTGTQYFHKENEVILPRNTSFEVTEVEEYANETGGKAYRLKISPILTDKNYKPEEVTNGSDNEQQSGTSTGIPDSAGEESGADSSPAGQDDAFGGGYDSSDSGTGGTDEISEQSSEGSEDPAVVPAPAGEDAAAQEESVAPINGAKVMQSKWAADEGLSLEEWKAKHNVPENGLFPNKNKTVTNDSGEEFVANAVVSNPKFGQGIASIILPSTKSVKVLYKDHGYKVTQAKNLSLVDSPSAAVEAAPDEVLDLSNALPGNVGTNPLDGKMYFVGKDGNALFIGDEVEYTKKGVTQKGTVSSIYKGTSTVKVNWDDDTSSVKKASQLYTPENSEDSSTTPEDIDSASETGNESDNTPETAEAVEAPETAVDSADGSEDVDSPEEAPAAPAATEETVNKGWTPVEGYDDMGPTKVQILPNLTQAIVYPHDHSGNPKTDYTIKGKMGYNPVEDKDFGVGKNLQPLYVGDEVAYLWLNKSYKGRIVKLNKSTNSASVELEDGTITNRKVSVLSGNKPKFVDVDENGNYTDWYGNQANIPTLKKDSNQDSSSAENDSAESSDNTADNTGVSIPESSEEISASETPEIETPSGEFVNEVTPEWAEDLPVGSVISVDGADFYKVHHGYFMEPGTPDQFENKWSMSTKINNAGGAILKGKDASQSFDLSYETLNELGTGAQIINKRLGVAATKDFDGDWHFPGMGYIFKNDDWNKKWPFSGWEITKSGVILEQFSYNKLSEKPNGTTATIDGVTYTKFGDGWLEPSNKDYYTSADLSEKYVKSTDPDSAAIDEDIPESNISYSDLEDLEEGSKLVSQKLGLNLVMDSDSDWSEGGNVGYGLDYISNYDLLDTIVTDDWEIIPAEIPSNYDEYTLDISESFSELYSPKHQKTWIKNKSGDWWDDSGNEVSSGGILSEYPDSEYSLTESVLDETYEDAYDIHEQVMELPAGSTIEHTSQADIAPDTYIKNGPNEWYKTEYDGITPQLEISFTDFAFESGYAKIVSVAEEGSYTPAAEFEWPEANHPDFEKGEMTLEWAENAPVGTSLKSSMSSKWTYLKDEDGKWYPHDTFGVKKGTSVGGTSEQMVDAGETYNFVHIYVPESQNGTSAVTVAEMVPGTTIVSGDNIFTKDADGNWKMSVNGTHLDTSVPEALVEEFHAKLSPEVNTPEAVNSEDKTEEVIDWINSELDGSGTAASEETPAVPEAAILAPGTKHYGPLQDTDAFDNLPVGSVLKPDPKFFGSVQAKNGTWVYKKTDTGTWSTVKSDGSQSTYVYDSYTFHEMIGKEDYQDMVIEVPADGSSAPTVDFPETINEMTQEQFESLPIGTKLSTSKTYHYEKVSEDGWISSLSENLLKNSLFSPYIGDPQTLKVSVVSIPGADNSDQKMSTIPLADASVTESYLKGLSPGTKMKNNNSDAVITKGGDGLWTASNSKTVYQSSEFISFPSWLKENWSIEVPADYSSNSVSPDVSQTKNLKDMTPGEIADLPNGTVINLVSHPEMVTFTKVGPNEWSATNGTKHSDSVWQDLTGVDDSYQAVFPSGSSASPQNTSQPATDSSTATGVITGVKELTTEGLDAYPVGTTLKKEVHAPGMSSAEDWYYQKQPNGNWQAYKKTANTLQTKSTYASAAMYKSGIWTVSTPKTSKYFTTKLGEIGYVGDSVTTADGQQGSVLKIMKTGLKLQLPSGEKITVKESKLTKGDPSFGVINLGTGSSSTSNNTATTPSVDYSSAAPSESFAGASAAEYNKQGVVMASNPSPVLHKGLEVLPAHEPDTTNPLYGTDRPEEPASPKSYPAFESPELELPVWDSAEWLKKVEQRYLDNPNKAKSTVQESNKWSSIENVLKGEKQNLSNLLSSKYLDEDLYNEAIAGIDAQTEKNAPLIEAHKEIVSQAKQKYDADKENHFAAYNELKSKFDADLKEWIAANPDPDAIKLVSFPEVSKENFSGETADWNKAHIGTHSAQTVFDSIKQDNVLGSHGLSMAIDSEKVENLDISVKKILDTSGVESLDARFKVTVDHGKVLEKLMENSGGEKSGHIFPPKFAKDAKSGLMKEQSGTSHTNYGKRFVYTHENGAKIIFQRDKKDEKFNNDTNHNSVRVVMPIEHTPEQFQEVLDFLKIESKPSTEGDIKVLAENRLINMFGSGETAIGPKNLGGAAREAALEKIKKEYNISSEDLVLETAVDGRVRLHLSPEKTKHLAQKFSGIKSFLHNVSSGDDVDTWLNILTGTNPGLASTYNRWSNGISTSGMSSSTDMSYGSGDYVYTSPHGSLASGGARVSIHPEAILRRTDVWANYSDNYGKKNSDGKSFGAFEKLNKFSTQLHEVLPQSSVPLNDFQFISVPSTYVRSQLIERLKKMGVLKINGFNIEDFIITSGMTPPASDYIPGYGVVPQGTIPESLPDLVPAVVAPAAGGGPAA